MTEVDAVVPENVSISPAQTLVNPSDNREINSSATTTATNNGTLQPMEQLNGGDDRNEEMKDTVATMEVDAPESDGEDSQVTASSTENGVGCEESKFNEGVVKEVVQTSSAENSREAINVSDPHVFSNKQTDALSTASSCNEDSSNACDNISQNIAAKSNESSGDELPPIIAAAVIVDDVRQTDDDEVEKEEFPKSDCGRNEVENCTDDIVDTACPDSSSVDKPESRVPDERQHSNMSTEAKDKIPNNVPANDLNNSTRDQSLPQAEALGIQPISVGNGAASGTEKDDAGIVDLGDDSDDEAELSSSRNQQEHETPANNTAMSEEAVNLSVNKAKSVCSDSDGAVVIGSDDSESEIEQAASFAQTCTTNKADSPQEIIDDDDDDCVVIEDDADMAISADISKRKNATADSATNSDDSQPPNKRQRTSLPSTTNQITIKDARTLMSQEICGKDSSNEAAGSIYPVNIRPAGCMQGPPKLVPVTSAAAAAVNLPLSTLPGFSANTNLLPGLTDDMYVLEAPSFIVPYIYEKPPPDNLRDIVKVIESKYDLSREELAQSEKGDEFDMMTEQNKMERDEKAVKKKKKRRGAQDPDESWSEESDEDDEEEEDDSDADVRTKVLIKEAQDDFSLIKGAIKLKSAAALVSPTASPAVGVNVAAASKPGLENYFESPLGKFFMDIGVGLVQEFVQSDLIRLQKRKMRKSLGKNIMGFERAITALSGNLEASRRKNIPFKFTMKRCEFCNFKSESALSMANHYETPHMNGALYKCNFCVFEIRNVNEIIYHMEAVHNIKARLIKPLPYHQCPNCGFEDNGKAKLARHQLVCVKKFRPEFNLAPPHDWEAPAKIPRIKPRHGLVGTATAYQAMTAQAAAQKAALATIQHQQQQAAQVRSMQAAALAAQNAANKIRGRTPAVTKPGPPNTAGVAGIRGPNQVRSPMATNVVMPNNFQLAGTQLLQNANALAKKTLSGQPSISITPLPRQSGSAHATAPANANKMPPAGMKPGQSPSGNKAQFVICEICDGYIKDLEQLRNHMQWMHKVKIHPKMIYNRPPLNCQKCQFRFFTDQGLERHLLGSHGLVTSSMQEAANKGKDAGRCPVCGRLYQWKLLNHVSRDHHMTLKPAHLSYKCTVCTATFGMYKQFETHVYTAHSTVAKKAMDGKKNNTGAATSSAVSSGSQRSSLSAASDSLLKPLKINDEITIIPQPATKSRITNMESHVID